MNDLERTYFDAAFASQYPEFVEAEREEKNPKPEKGSRERAQENAPGMDAAAKGLLDTLAGALKGATAATIGLPGDVESLVRVLTGGAQILPTTEDMQAKLPAVVPKDERQSAPETMGEFLPLAPIALTRGVVKAIKKGVTK